jgi:AAA15 family ATPase/GTPase
MLIEFTVSNYRSFRDPTTLSLEAARLRSEDAEVDQQNCFQANQMQLLKVAGVYGPNASGKSNLIRALHTMVHFVRNSSREGQAGDRLPAIVFKLNSATLKLPSHFEIVLANEQDQFRYGFEITAERVHGEWLHRRPLKSSREHRLFKRTGDAYQFHRDFSEGRDLRKRTRDNALHLSVCAQFDGKISRQVMLWFENLKVINGLMAEGLLPYTIKMLEQKETSDAVRQLVKRFDVGISGLETIHHRFSEDDLAPGHFPDGLRQTLLEEGYRTLKTTHQVYNQEGHVQASVDFEIEDESDGTQKLIALSGILVDTLRQGHVLVIDEFDARLHPFISREIVRLFQSNTTNPRNAQLLFTTHDTNLLDRRIFRRDQLWFIEKHPQQAWSELYSLAEFRMEDGKGVRNDARFEKEYLEGRFGAVPFLGNFQEIVGEALKTSVATGKESA